MTLGERKLVRKIVLGIMLILLLIGMLTLAFNIQPVKASGTIYIWADGSIDPPTASISTVDSITYTFTGNINDSIDIERDNIVVDGAGYTLQGDGGVGIDLSGRSNVTIKKINIKGFWQGIHLSSFSSNNTIDGNNLTNNVWGICLYESSYNFITENLFINNGLFVSSSYGNVVEDNLVNGKPLVYLEGVSHLNVSEAGQVILLNCEYIRVENLNLSYASVGVLLWKTKNTIISGNNITNNQYGIWLWGFSSYNSISGNHITANYRYGMRLSQSSNNMLRNNTMANNGWNFGIVGNILSHFLNDIDVSNTVDGKPIYYWINEEDRTVPVDAGYVALVNCTRVTVQNLNLTNNIQGILLVSTANSTIIKNNITSNGSGISLFFSSNYNTLSRNNITNNGCGIGLVYSSNNFVNHNNFINNDIQVLIEDSFKNKWDDGYSSGGNYWSDYTGVDFYIGPYQNVTGSDGIGDTPYIIDANNQDNYPLMNPWTPLIGDVNNDKAVNILDCIAAASAFGSYPDHPRWNMKADINQDNKVNILDIIVIAKNFGKTYP